MSRHSKLILLLLVLFLLLSSALAEAAGLNTTFGVVTLENLDVGKTYSTRETAGLALSVLNTGKEPVDLKIEVVLPETSELKEGYECLPDISWIKLEKDHFEGIKLNEAAVTDVVISIPNNQKYSGKKYQVFIWTHTAGRAIGVGLKSKLLLNMKGANNE